MLLAALGVEGLGGWFFCGIGELWVAGRVLRGFGGSNLIAKLVKACCATQHVQESSLCRERTCLGTDGRDGEQRCKEQPGNQQKRSG